MKPPAAPPAPSPQLGAPERGKRTPATTKVVYLETPLGLVEPAVQADTAAEFLREMNDYITRGRGRDEPELWVELKTGDYVRWSAVTAITARSAL